MSLALYLDHLGHSNPHKPQPLSKELQAVRIYGWECNICKAVAESQLYVQYEKEHSIYNIWRDIDRCFLWVRCQGCGLTNHYDCLPQHECPSVEFLMMNPYKCELCIHLPC